MIRSVHRNDFVWKWVNQPACQVWGRCEMSSMNSWNMAGGRNVVEGLRSSASQGKFMVRVYSLLGLTLLVSALATFWGMEQGLGTMLRHPIILMVLNFGILFLLMAVQRVPVVNVLVTLLFAGVMGASLGPAIAQAVSLPGGAGIVTNALLLTTAIFFSLSLYAMVSGKSFSFLGSFLFTGLIIVVILSLVQIFWHPAFLQVIVAGMGALVFSGLILFDTARILSSSEEEMTPVMAVVSLYLDVLNLFLSLLRILEIFRGRD